MGSIRGKKRNSKLGFGKPKGSGSSKIFEALRKQILDVDLPPGTDIDEQGLVERYGVSRTPVREALIRLASEKLVQIVPNRGARVASLDISQVPAMLEALELLERAVTRFCALRRKEGDLDVIRHHCKAFERASLKADHGLMVEENRKFHDAIAASCGNNVLRDNHRAVAMETSRLARMAFMTANIEDPKDGYYGSVRTHHQKILTAIDKQDPEAADHFAVAHARLFRDRMLRFISRNDADDIRLD